MNGDILKTVSPTINTVQYSSGDAVGGAQTVTDAISGDGPSTLKSLTIIDKANQKAAMQVVLFSQAPTGALTNNAAYTMDTADSPYVIGKIDIAATDWTTVGGVAVCTKEVAFVIDSTTPANQGSTGGRGGAVYAVVTTTGTPTYAVGDLVFKYGVLRAG